MASMWESPSIYHKSIQATAQQISRFLHTRDLHSLKVLENDHVLKIYATI